MRVKNGMQLFRWRKDAVQGNPETHRMVRTRFNTGYSHRMCTVDWTITTAEQCLFVNAKDVAMHPRPIFLSGPTPLESDAYGSNLIERLKKISASAFLLTAILRFHGVLPARRNPLCPRNSVQVPRTGILTSPPDFSAHRLK